MKEVSVNEAGKYFPSRETSGEGSNHTVSRRRGTPSLGPSWTGRTKLDLPLVSVFSSGLAGRYISISTGQTSARDPRALLDLKGKRNGSNIRTSGSNRSAPCRQPDGCRRRPN